MNILPKKRWHVRTKDNVARVRRDEKKAAEEEKRVHERIQLAEQEHRLGVLRAQASAKKGLLGVGISSAGTGEGDEDGDGSTAPAFSLSNTTDGHVNLFVDIEAEENSVAATRKPNEEHDKEKKAEQNAWENKIGILKYLGEGSSEYSKEKPWYQQSASDYSKEASKEAADKKDAKKTEPPPGVLPGGYRKLNITATSHLPTFSAETPTGAICCCCD